MSFAAVTRTRSPLALALLASLAACDKPPVPPAADSTAAAVPQSNVVPIATEGKWKGVGRTERGTAVYVDTTSVRDSASVRLGTFRIKHPKPFVIDSGRKSFVMSEADLIAACGARTLTVARQVRHYSDLDGQIEVSRREDPRDPFNVESPGTFGDISAAHLCSSPESAAKPTTPTGAPSPAAPAPKP